MTGPSDEKLLKMFGRNLAQIRKNQEMTQQQLAENLNMSVVAVAYLETGKRWARIGTLSKLAEALKVDIESFFKGL